MNKKTKLPKLTVIEFPETGWISNFWIRDQNVFFTDSALNKKQNFLLSMEFKVLLENLKNKNTWDRKFITHPSPLLSNPIEISQTELKIEQIVSEYIFNLDENNNPILNDAEYLYLGQKDNFKFYKNLKLKKTFFWNEKAFIEYKYNIRKMINVGDETILLTEDNQIIYQDMIVYSSSQNLMIANFDTKAFLISEEATTELFYLNLDDLNKKNIIWKGVFFFRLDCFNKQLIIGKPLKLNDQINYHLPLKFIY
ncbi:hypothetical protein ELUMI_v1c03430 [Williamsoniiplasma luminosum]|uniref:Uncharacterized protein n=1 Tax=Williamsoniiplasma luminosum TaxID=214888 RepID=A0A2K8NV78_9MOLU|nr:hypothetical protein [Williamsoniiplasma luminosum]ATZ17068.1 hypothetical protein ELUMI_v1c03430 [Williamsoniiplasma luminosum]